MGNFDSYHHAIIKNGDLFEVPDFDGLYLLSEDGRVYRRWVKGVWTNGGFQRRVKLRELKPFLGWRNCLMVSLSMDGRKQNRSINALLREVGVYAQPKE